VQHHLPYVGILCDRPIHSILNPFTHFHLSSRTSPYVMDWSRESDDGFIPFPTDAISPVSQQDFIVREGGGIRAGDPQMMDSKHPLKNSSLYQSGRITPTARLISNPTPPNLQTDKNAKTDKLEAMKAKLMESRRLNGASVPLPKNSTKSSLTAAHPQLDSDTSAAVADIIRKGEIDLLKRILEYLFKSSLENT